MKRYIAKADTWFKAGTECKLIADAEWMGGFFQGTHIIENEIDARNRNRKIGDEVEDEELCDWDEFDIIED